MGTRSEEGKVIEIGGTLERAYNNQNSHHTCIQLSNKKLSNF